MADEIEYIIYLYREKMWEHVWEEKAEFEFEFESK